MKMYCYDCDKDVEPIKKKVKEHYSFRGKDFDTNMDLFYCPLCNAEIASEEKLNNQLAVMWNGYLKCFNLSLNSFKEIRVSYGLTQDLFAKILGWGKRSVIRYENHDEIPQGEYLNTYIKLSLDSDIILEYLELNKDSLTSGDYKKILNRLQLNISIKARNAILYILKDNALFVLQLIKNMFAVDFLSYKNYGSAITNFDYIKMEYGPVIDGYKDIINSMIKTDEIKIADIQIIDGLNVLNILL